MSFIDDNLAEFDRDTRPADGRLSHHWFFAVKHATGNATLSWKPSSKLIQSSALRQYNELRLVEFIDKGGTLKQQKKISLDPSVARDGARLANESVTITLTSSHVDNNALARVASNDTTTLTSNVTEDEGETITVASTSDFPDKGVIRINDEDIAYTSKDATTFIGLTRGYNDTTATNHSIPVSVLQTAIYTYTPAVGELVRYFQLDVMKANFVATTFNVGSSGWRFFSVPITPEAADPFVNMGDDIDPFQMFKYDTAVSGYKVYPLDIGEVALQTGYGYFTRLDSNVEVDVSGATNPPRR